MFYQIKPTKHYFFFSLLFQIFVRNLSLRMMRSILSLFRFGRLFLIIFISTIIIRLSIILSNGIMSGDDTIQMKMTKHTKYVPNISNKNTSQWLVHTSQCRIPNVPIFDDEIRKIYSSKKNRKWRYKKSIEPIELSKIRRLNNVFVDIPKNLRCNITEIVRLMKTESYDLGKTIYDVSGLVHTGSFDAVQVKCAGFNLTKVIPMLPVKKTQIGWLSHFESKKSPFQKPNILMFGIDSLSRFNFHRHLLKTKDFLSEKSFVKFYGHHKVGGNSFPNMIPMMIGDLVDNWYKLWNKDKKLDVLPLIFEKYRNNGYLTTYIEDTSEWGLFESHETKGFYKVPFDYYLRPFSLLMEHDVLNRYSYRQKLQTEVIF